MERIASRKIEVKTNDFEQCTLTVRQYKTHLEFLLKHINEKIIIRVYRDGHMNRIVNPDLKQLDYKKIMSTSGITRRQLNYYFNEGNDNLTDEQLVDLMACGASDRNEYMDYWKNRKKIIKLAVKVIKENSNEKI